MAYPNEDCRPKESLSDIIDSIRGYEKLGKVLKFRRDYYRNLSQSAQAKLELYDWVTSTTRYNTLSEPAAALLARALDSL